MLEVAPSELKLAVESQHGGMATYVQSVPIHEEHDGQTVWDGMVAVFDLAGHPKATRAYAWSYERPDGARRFFAVLHTPPVQSPRDAVRAAIVAEARAVNDCPACAGSGKVLDEMHRALPGASGTPKINPPDCPECNGTGRRKK